MCLTTEAASAAAARQLHYPGLAEMIEQEHMAPRAIARLFGMTFTHASRPRCSRDCVVILLSGAIGRHCVNPDGWSGEAEWLLALQALAGISEPEKTLVRLSKDAQTIVSDWARRRGTGPPSP